MVEEKIIGMFIVLNKVTNQFVFRYFDTHQLSKMKYLFILSAFIVFTHQALLGQFEAGFDKKEAIDMIRICNSHTFLELYNSDAPIIPNGYKRTYSSQPNVLDNMFQVYEKGDFAVIHFRGSTVHPNSWIENLYSAMIPASGSITVYNERRDYSFAKYPDAAVHSGYALAITLLSEDIIAQINRLNAKGIFQIYLTGHSQGGALATMSRAYIENLPKGIVSDKNAFKTYAFANPMSGNAYFALEYNKRFTQQGTSFRIINPSDIVPSLPLSPKQKELFSADNLLALLTGEDTYDLKKLGIELLIKQFGDGFTSYVNKSNQMIHKMITMQAGEVILPEYVEDITYSEVGEVYKLKTFVYPTIIKDSLEINPSDFSKYTRLPDGKYQRKEPKFYQHKPYNYYVEMLRIFDENEYKRLKIKFLPENL